jgi:hypothetical protein
VAEDFLFTLRACIQGDVVMIPDVVRGHRHHAGQTDLKPGWEISDQIVDEVAAAAPAAIATRIKRRKQTLDALRELHRRPDRTLTETVMWLAGPVARDPALFRTPVGRNVVLPMVARLVLGALRRRILQRLRPAG